MSIIQIHFDGDIVTDHKVSMRTLGKTLLHLQNSVDRAHLDIKYGGIWKHARMPSSDYIEANFLIQEIKEGGFILDFISENSITKKLIDRISIALTPAIEAAMKEGEDEMGSLIDQVNNQKKKIANEASQPLDFERLVEHPDKKVIRQYGDRSIVKEIDQILSIIRAKTSGDSSLDLVFKGHRTRTYQFDKETSTNFHKIVSTRSIGDPVLYAATLRSLDNKNLNGKIDNLINNKTATLHLPTLADFEKVHPFLISETEMSFIGCPLIEYGTFDPQAGDIYFIDLA